MNILVLICANGSVSFDLYKLMNFKATMRYNEFPFKYNFVLYLLFFRKFYYLTLKYTTKIRNRSWEFIIKEGNDLIYFQYSSLCTFRNKLMLNINNKKKKKAEISLSISTLNNPCMTMSAADDHFLFIFVINVLMT